MARHPTSSAALDEAERSWWSENGDIEERFCWVQTPGMQRVVRKRYIDAMIRELPAGARVLELGCGTGWLCLLLAERGVRSVVGCDFSASQIDRARRASAERGLDDRVRFVLDDGPGLLGDERFDAVIMHAFLHHLTTTEISQAIAQSAGSLTPSGTLLLMEPVHDPRGRDHGPVELSLLRRIEALPRALVSRRLRRQSGEEAEIRRLLAGRAAGTPPFGPAPKEIPFSPDEIRGLIEPRFRVQREVPVLSFAHLVAQEVLVASLSQPRLWSLTGPALVRLASWLDRRVIRRPVLPSTAWVFILTVCSQAP